MQEDIIGARQAGRDLARAAGFGTVDQTRIATAISELVRNALLHAGGGLCRIAVETTEASATLQVTVSDDGPGIPDIALAMQPGHSTTRGLGLGLSAVRSLMGGLSIESRPGRTTVVTSMTRRR
ncbi:Anti-sigma B factor RsbT [Rhodovulum sp. PH10]|nr:Anti-sigma B factor RsbT [Rhodovulum sp. PH10]